MRILFFFVHPSKYYLFKHTINYLKAHGHTVDIAIITKDILEDLVKHEGWTYTNIFPEGRRNPNLPILVATGVNFLKTIVRLQRLTKGKRHDLYITDDSLVVTGKLRNVPTLFFTDNELSTVPESAVLLALTTGILAPSSVNLGRFEKKKIGFNSYKELAYLHPKYFSPNPAIVEAFNPEKQRYFLIRLVAMTASHDRGIHGITDENLQKLIQLLERYGRVFITTERKLPQQFQHYRLRIAPQDIAHALFYADMFIGDSGTMASEAAVLGVPSLMYHDFIGRLHVMKEKEQRYDLMYGFTTREFDKLHAKVDELMRKPHLKKMWQKKRQFMLDEKEDVTEFMLQTIESFASTAKSKYKD